ncbi:hypothetical protein HN385_05455 [archaeon]|jgi:large subunit ribosomal protein L31e|nr:hypothetical protein [archaeon]MBT3451074.1 hypothetical protein [archaeon]MBT6869470.1 hypothetical protein [archaeon]MBT7193158.1 hypothetical protein [archaeon]MBT7380464.1 hypothetical protein [archaeon]
MAKKDAQLERTYNVPLRKEYQKAPSWKRTKKAVRALKNFLEKHMKSDDVRLSKPLNEEMWKHGIRNPPHHIKVNVKKDEEGIVRADLFGEKKAEKKPVKKELKKAEPAKEIKSSKKEETKKATPKVEKKE